MHRKILATAVIFALSIPVPAAFARPAKPDTAAQQGSANDQNQDNRQASDQLPDPWTAGSPVPAALPYDPYANGPYRGALTPPPPAAFDQQYPVCTKEIRDGCINQNSARRQSGESGEASE